MLILNSVLATGFKKVQTGATKDLKIFVMLKKIYTNYLVETLRIIMQAFLSKRVCREIFLRMNFHKILVNIFHHIVILS